MDRRGFLEVGVVSGAAVALQGCASLGGPPAPAADAPGEPFEASTFLSRIDRTLGFIAAGAPLGLLSAARGPRSASQSPDAALESRLEPGELLLFQKSLRTVALVGALNELPSAARQHPDVQARLARHTPEMNEAVLGVAGALEGLGAADRARMRKRLRQEPDLPMRIVSGLDDDAKLIGVSLEGRVRLRALATETAWRLRHQPLALADEYVAQVRKVASREGVSEHVQRAIAAQATTAALWDGAGRQFAQNGWPPAAPPQPGWQQQPGWQPQPAWQTQPTWQPPAKSGSTGKVVGGSIMALAGIPLLIAGIAVAMSSGAVGAICIIPGAGLIIGGIILIAVGLPD